MKGEGASRKHRPKFKCSHCGYSTRDVEHMTNHVKNLHLQIAAYKCGHRKCSHQSVSKALLAKHKRTAHHIVKQTTSRLKCDICGFKCCTMTQLQRHNSLNHDSDKPWVCPVCYTSFQLESEFEKHFKEKHGEDSAVCGICGFRSTGAEVKLHIIRSHLRSMFCEKKVS